MKLKIDPSRLPEPRLAPTKPVRIDKRPFFFSPEAYENQRQRRETTQEKVRRGGHIGGGDRRGVWSKEKDEKLKELYLEGKTHGDIADALHMPLGSVSHRIYDLRKSGAISNTRKPNEREWKDDEVRTLIELYTNGVFPKEIAPKLGRSIGACSSKLTELRRKGLLKIDRREYTRRIAH